MACYPDRVATVLERLLDLLLSIWGYVLPWTVISEDRCGVVLRLGRYRRDITPGWNWKWPGFEEVRTTSAALDSIMLGEQSLTSSDGAQVTLSGCLTYRVSDARTYIMAVEDAQSVVTDVGCAVIAETAPGYTREQILGGDEFLRELRKRMRSRAKKWGVSIEYVGLTDRVEAQVVRLIGGLTTG